MANIRPLAFLPPKETDNFVKKLATSVAAHSRGENGSFLTDENGRQWRLAARGYKSGGSTKTAVEMQVSDGNKHWSTIFGVTEDGTIYGKGTFTGSTDFSALGLEHQ